MRNMILLNDADEGVPVLINMALVTTCRLVFNKSDVWVYTQLHFQGGGHLDVDASFEQIQEAMEEGKSDA